MTTHTTQAPGTMRTAIDEANRRFVAAMNEGDFARATEVYTPDAAILPPNAEMVEGRENIEGFWRSAAEALGVENVSLETLRLEPMGEDRACEIGRYHMKLQQGEDRGKYIVLWNRQQDGSWRWHYDIWNSDLAPAGA